MSGVMNDCVHLCLIKNSVFIVPVLVNCHWPCARETTQAELTLTINRPDDKTDIVRTICLYVYVI